jgi:hypothetical protein
MIHMPWPSQIILPFIFSHFQVGFGLEHVFFGLGYNTKILGLKNKRVENIY